MPEPHVIARRALIALHGHHKSAAGFGALMKSAPKLLSMGQKAIGMGAKAAPAAKLSAKPLVSAVRPAAQAAGRVLSSQPAKQVYRAGMNLAGNYALGPAWPVTRDVGMQLGGYALNAARDPAQRAAIARGTRNLVDDYGGAIGAGVGGAVGLGYGYAGNLFGQSQQQIRRNQQPLAR